MSFCLFGWRLICLWSFWRMSFGLASFCQMLFNVVDVGKMFFFLSVFVSIGDVMKGTHHIKCQLTPTLRHLKWNLGSRIINLCTLYTYLPAYPPTCMNAWMQVCIHKHTYIHTHTRNHAYTYIHSYMVRGSFPVDFFPALLFPANVFTAIY